MIADTIGFSRMEIQFQPILERNSPKLNLRRLKHGGIQTEKFAPGKVDRGVNAWAIKKGRTDHRAFPSV